MDNKDNRCEGTDRRGPEWQGGREGGRDGEGLLQGHMALVRSWTPLQVFLGRLNRGEGRKTAHASEQPRASVGPWKRSQHGTAT